MTDHLPTKRNIFRRCISARYVLAMLGSIGFGIIYGLKVNFHVAIVSMVNHTALELPNLLKLPSLGDSEPSGTCKVNNTGSTFTREDGPFTWSNSLQGTLLSAYFWGYIVAQIPGGRIAELFSAKWVMFFAVSINVLCSLLTPIMSKLHYGALLAMRIGEGIGGGVSFPAMHVMLAHWAPPSERSVMSSVVYSGTALGTVVFTFFTGIIAGQIGWEAVFYIEGGICATWLLLWGCLISDSPQSQTAISEEERQYIVQSLNVDGEGETRKKVEISNVPWKAVFTSPPFLAILIAHTFSNWGWYMVLIELPQYMKNVLNFNISENSILSAIPFFCMWIFSMILSKILDYLRQKNLITTTSARKSATLISTVIPMVCFVILCFIGCRKALAVVLMTVTVTAIGGMFSGFLSNHIDIAPNYAGTLMALTNTVATIPGIIVPIFVGKQTESDPSINSWKTIFWTTASLYVVAIVIYSIFASGEQEEWNNYSVSNEDSIEAQPLKTPQSPSDEKKNYEATTQGEEEKTKEEI